MINISEILSLVFSQASFQSAIASSILIIMLGFLLGKKGVFTKPISQALSTVLLGVALPSLAFTAFMTEINENSLRQGMNLLVWGFIMYIMLIFICEFLYIKYKGDSKTALIVCTVFGSTTFFGIPIISALYGSEGVIYANVFNISYRVFLYSYALIKMSGVKFEVKQLKQIFLNPIIIATFLGLFIWIFQSSLPQVELKSGESVAFLRIDKTIPWLFSAMKRLAALTSPLAWLAIGNTLSTISIGEAITSKDAWYYSVNKVIIIPIINLVILTILTITNIIPFSGTGLAVVIIMMATPTATVAATYAIKYDKAAVMSSNCSLLSTVFSVFLIPIWVIVLEVLKAANIF